MPKFLSIILVALLLGAGLLPYKSPFTFALLALGMAVFVTVINFYSQNRSILPGAFVLGYLGVLAIVSSLSIKLILAVLAAGVFYYYHQSLPKKPAFLDEEFFIMAAAILLLSALWGVNFFFTPPWWAISLLTLVFFVPILREAFLKLDAPTPVLLAFLNVLILVEVTMALLYWPVNVLTATVVVFAVFYLQYVFSALYYMRKLTKKRIYFHSSLISFVVLATLLTSKWSI